MIPMHIRVTAECYQILTELSADLGVPVARLIEDCVWQSPRARAYAAEHGIKRQRRTRQGRPPRGERGAE
jgi:hypothetical protein